jgi:hypothetical protein
MLALTANPYAVLSLVLIFFDFLHLSNETCLVCLKMAYIWFRLMTFNSRTSKQTTGEKYGSARSPMGNHEGAA